METIGDWFRVVREVLDIPLLKSGETELTLWLLIYLIILVVLLFFLTGKLKNWVVNGLLARSHIDIGVRQAIGSILRYVFIVIGFLVILQTAGIDLTALNILAGAVGIGLGFGLQNIANNFISGLIILFERPIKIGDRIEVDDVIGDVVAIGARSTTVLTNDNIAIIVPNSKFISENVINWSYNDRQVRFKIPVGVSYGSDVKLVEKLLLEVAAENQDVLENPEPAVRLLQFGDSSLNFELRAWSTSLLHQQGKLLSALNFAIIDKFREHNVEIPYPQRDLHFRDIEKGASLSFTSGESDGQMARTRKQ